jgi:reactive intermediate/imine deaminase
MRLKQLAPTVRLLKLTELFIFRDKSLLILRPVKFVEGGIAEQTDQVLKNIGAILEAAGFSFKDVVKSTCLLDDMNNFQAMNTVYSNYYPEHPPARAAYGVVKLPLGAMIEIETIAVKVKKKEA